MKKEFLYIFIFFLFSFGYSQSEEEEILKIILKEINFDSNEGILQCEKGKIFFLRKDYQEETNIPLEILDELEKVAVGINEKHLGKWCRPCKSRLKWEKKQKKVLISISQPIFDTEKNYCVVSVSITRRIGSATGITYMLKKIENNWNIVAYLELWIT